MSLGSRPHTLRPSLTGAADPQDSLDSLTVPSLLNRVFESICRPLRVRIEQVNRLQDGWWAAAVRCGAPGLQLAHAPRTSPCLCRWWQELADPGHLTHCHPHQDSLTHIQNERIDKTASPAAERSDHPMTAPCVATHAGQLGLARRVKRTSHAPNTPISIARDTCQPKPRQGPGTSSQPGVARAHLLLCLFSRCCRFLCAPLSSVPLCQDLLL